MLYKQVVMLEMAKVTSGCFAKKWRLLIQALVAPQDSVVKVQPPKLTWVDDHGVSAAPRAAVGV